MSWYPYLPFPYGYGLPMPNPEEVASQPWQYVPANPEDLTSTAEQPGLLSSNLLGTNGAGESAGESAGPDLNNPPTRSESETPATDASFRPSQPGGVSAYSTRQTSDNGPENIIAEICKLCTVSQGRVQALSQAISRQPGMPGSLQELMNNDLRGLAQQFVTTTHYCHLLEQKLEERTRATFQERTSERAAHEAHLESYRQQMKKANEMIDRLSKELRDFDNAYSRTEKSRKVDLERKTEKLTEKINNQKRRINEQQNQIETLKRKVSEGSKLSRGSILTDNREQDDSPELPFPHSATSELGAKHRRSPPIPQPKMPSGISLKDEEYLLNTLKNMKMDLPPSSDGFRPSSRAMRMEKDNEFKYGPPPPPSYGHFGSHPPPMSNMASYGSGPSALGPYGCYPPVGSYGAASHSCNHRRTPPNSGYQGPPHGYPPPSFQGRPLSRSRASHSTRNSQSGPSGALILRRDDDSSVDAETKTWKEMFVRLFKTVRGWSESHCRKIVPGAAEAATRNNAKLWEYMLKVAACYKDPQAAPKHALFMLNSAQHRTHFITRLILQYIEQEMLHYKLWIGWDENSDHVVQNAGPMIDFMGHPLEQHRFARQQMRTIVEGIVNDPEYSRFRTYKTTEHAARFKDIAGPFLSPDSAKSEASLGLHSIANLAMEISHKIMTSRLSFTFTWNECAVKFSHDSHIAMNSDQHGLALQHKHTRVMLVITPSISYREHTGASIVARGVVKAQVLIME